MHKRLLLLFTSWIPLTAAAMDCPDPPQQVSKDTKASVEVAVGRLGVLKAADAAIAVNRVTVDLLKSVPRADQIYLEQMLFAAYCSSVRDDKSTSDAEKSKSIRAYAIEVRRALSANDELKRAGDAASKPTSPTGGQRKPEKGPLSESIRKDFLAYEQQRRLNGSADFFQERAALRYGQWLTAAKAGYPMAQVLVGRALLLGTGVDKSPEAALAWFRKAADAEDAAGLFNLGYLYDLGMGVEENKATALVFYRAAEARQHSGAVARIGAFYRFGLGGLPQDTQEAVAWFERASKLGEAHASYDLATLYEEGAPGIKKDAEQAERYYKEAASMGHQVSRGYLAAGVLAQAIERYAGRQDADPDRAKDTAAARLALHDLTFVKAEALVSALDRFSVRTAVERIQQRPASDPMVKILDDTVGILTAKFRTLALNAKVPLMNQFSHVASSSLSDWVVAGRRRDVYDVCRDVFDHVDVPSLTEGEQDGTVKLISICSVSMVVLGYRQDAIKMTDAGFALVDKNIKARPWDWYLLESARGLGWDMGAALAEVGEQSKSQEFLLRSWNITFATFGREELIGRYTVLPVKGEVPKDVAADDRDFFKGFAEGNSSGKRITRFTVPIDFGGTTSPFYIYVIAGKNGYRQLQDQFIWVTEYRGGKVPPEVIESFHKLNRIAVENNVDFRELCVYALSDSPKKSEVKTAGGS